jgi:SAM-dependent methyltransferase
MTNDRDREPAVRNPLTGVVLGDTVLQSDVLESLASAVNYNGWLTDLAADHLGDAPIELGSGLGNYAQAWLDAGVPHITVTELDPERLAGLHARFGDEPRIDVQSFDVSQAPEAEHSALVAINVLEHIPDDVQALKAAHALLRPGGRVVMFVPAFQFAMSRFDRKIGHVRRYTVPSLRQAMQAAGLDVEEIRYVNLPGLPIWTLGMRLLRMSPKDSAALTIWDRVVIPITRRLESRFRPPFGQSVFAVARVPS